MRGQLARIIFQRQKPPLAEGWLFSFDLPCGNYQPKKRDCVVLLGCDADSVNPIVLGLDLAIQAEGGDLAIPSEQPWIH